MAKIFWAVCPSCEQQFYAVRELLLKNLQLRCPYCHTLFKPSQAKKIME